MKVLCITPNRERDYLAECVIEVLKENNAELYCTDFGNGVEKIYREARIMGVFGIFHIHEKSRYHGGFKEF